MQLAEHKDGNKVALMRLIGRPTRIVRGCGLDGPSAVAGKSKSTLPAGSKMKMTEVEGTQSVLPLRITFRHRPDDSDGKVSDKPSAKLASNRSLFISASYRAPAVREGLSQNLISPCSVMGFRNDSRARTAKRGTFHCSQL